MSAHRDAPSASVAGALPDLDTVRRVLLVRLRSIGDTVLMTPCISAIKAWRPAVEIDVLLEPFCAPLLEAHPGVSRVVRAGRSLGERARAARELRRRRYDLAIDLNGGTTAALLALASGARWRAGFAGYRNAWLRNVHVTSSHHVWGRTDVHTVEHQLALVAGIGIPVAGAGPTSLAVASAAQDELEAFLGERGLADRPFAVLHPEASLPSKRWPADRFARLASTLAERYGLAPVVIGQGAGIVRAAAGDAGVAAPGLPLSNVMALLARASLFVGNDSGPAHIAAAFERPAVVVFGPSNVDLWRPWSRAPWRVARGGETVHAVSEDEVARAVDAVLVEASALEG